MKKSVLVLCFLLALCMMISACGNNTEIDIDLSLLSSTETYAEINDMRLNPSDYIGKVVKMRGTMDIFENKSTGIRYFSCEVQGTDGSTTGLEFSLAGEHTYPDDYPAQDEEITVVGTFGMYTEEYNGETHSYLYLKDAEFVNR